MKRNGLIGKKPKDARAAWPPPYLPLRILCKPTERWHRAASGESNE